jgi:hypothetical protein
MPLPDKRLDQQQLRHRTGRFRRQVMARPLPPGADQALRTTLANEIANFDDIAARLADRQAPSQRARSETRTALRYDTVTTALRLFDPSWRQLAPVETPTEAPPEVEGLLAELSERDVIVDDTVVFPGWNRSRRSVAGWWEFRSRGRRLLIKSIDATHYEARTGADLVYLRREPDAFVLVQYKMLRQSRDGRWVYRIDRRLPGQLRRMIDCCQAATNGDHEPTSASTVDSFRIGPSSAFVKFVQPTRRLRADELTTGYYLPAEFVQLLLEGAAQNHPRTTVLRVPEGRYLDPRTFVRLVQDSWVGTLREPTQALRALLLRSTQRWRTTDVTFAYDEPMLDEDDNDR